MDAVLAEAGDRGRRCRAARRERSDVVKCLPAPACPFDLALQVRRSLAALRSCRGRRRTSSGEQALHPAIAHHSLQRQNGPSRRTGPGCVPVDHRQGGCLH
jgi:hypothetical protein